MRAHTVLTGFVTRYDTVSYHTGYSNTVHAARMLFSIFSRLLDYIKY